MLWICICLATALRYLGNGKTGNGGDEEESGVVGWFTHIAHRQHCSIEEQQHASDQKEPPCNNAPLASMSPPSCQLPAVSSYRARGGVKGREKRNVK